jgi:hypothetical protein
MFQPKDLPVTYLRRSCATTRHIDDHGDRMHYAVRFRTNGLVVNMPINQRRHFNWIIYLRHFSFGNVTGRK